MAGVLDYLREQAGKGRDWVNERGEDALQFIPPNLRSTLGLLEELSPVTAMDRAGQAAQRVVAPDRTMSQRGWDLLDMATETAGVAAPVMVANRAAIPASRAVQDALLGFSMGPEAAAATAFKADESGALSISSPWNPSNKFPADELEIGDIPPQVEKSLDKLGVFKPGDWQGNVTKYLPSFVTNKVAMEDLAKADPTAKKWLDEFVHVDPDTGNAVATQAFYNQMASKGPDPGQPAWYEQFAGPDPLKPPEVWNANGEKFSPPKLTKHTVPTKVWKEIADKTLVDDWQNNFSPDDADWFNEIVGKAKAVKSNMEQFSPETKDWLNTYVDAKMDKDGNMAVAYPTQTYTNHMFGFGKGLQSLPFMDDWTTDTGKLMSAKNYAGKPQDLIAEWNATPAAPKPKIKWQDVYDSEYTKLENEAMNTGDPDGPTSVDDLYEKYKNDSAAKDDFIQNEVENYYSQDWLDDQLNNDFVQLSDLDDEEILDMVLEDPEGYFGVDWEGLSKDDLWVSHHPDQLAMPGIGAVPEGPNEQGKAIINDVKSSMGNYWVDQNDNLPDDFTFAVGKVFDPNDHHVQTDLANYYDFESMASDSWDDYVDNSLEDDFLMSHYGVSEDDFMDNYYAQNPSEYADNHIDDNMMTTYGFDTNFDLFDDVPDDFDVDAFNAGKASPFSSSGNTQISPSSSFRMLAQETPERQAEIRQALLDIDAGNTPERQAARRLAVPVVRGYDDAKALEQAARARLGSDDPALQRARAQGYDLDLPLYHVGPQNIETMEAGPLRQRTGALYTGTGPTGSMSGAGHRGGEKNMHPLVFRGSIFGRDDLPENIQNVLLDRLETERIAGGAPGDAFVADSLMKLTENTPNALTRDEANDLAPFVLGSYFSQGGRFPGKVPDQPFTLRDPVERRADFAPGSKRQTPVPTYDAGSTKPSFERGMRSGEPQSYYQSGLQKLGFDAGYVSDEVEGHDSGMRTVAILQHALNKVRSIDAGFDPARMSSRNIYAMPGAVGAAGGVLGYLTHEQQQRQQQEQQRALMGGYF